MVNIQPSLYTSKCATHALHVFTYICNPAKTSYMYYTCLGLYMYYICGTHVIHVWYICNTHVGLKHVLHVWIVHKYYIYTTCVLHV